MISGLRGMDISYDIRTTRNVLVVYAIKHPDEDDQAKVEMYANHENSGNTSLVYFNYSRISSKPKHRS